MPSQNFFDEQHPEPSIVLDEHKHSSKKEKRKFLSSTQAAVVLTVMVVAAAGVVFVWGMKSPARTPKETFDIPDSLSQQMVESVNSEQPEATPAPTPDPIPRNEWYMKLVNAENPLPDDYGEQEMTAFGGGYYFDERIIESLEQMLNAADEADVSLKIISGYRGVERQTARNEDEIAAYERRGYSEQDARDLAAMEEPPYLQCEHSLGLAVDLMDSGSDTTSIAFEETEEFAWLQEHAAEYGFILRYPADKVEITGMVYEPWHYRYVGTEQAQKIKESGLCLEEYLGQSAE